MNRNHKNTHIIVILLALLFLSYYSYAQNQWDENGILAADVSAPGIGFDAVSDDSGNVYFTFQDTSNVGDYDIFVQKIDPAGTKKWTETGINVYNTGTNQKNPSIAVDGSGGAYVAWYDNSEDKLYLQHIDKNGLIDWVETGIKICTEDTTQQEVKLVSDNTGGVFAVWKDKRSDEGDIYAQYFDSNGNRKWADTGKAVTTASGLQSNYKPICTNNGDLIIAWKDDRNGNLDIYAQKISKTGIAEWTSNGIAIVTENSDQHHANIEKCGIYYIITWTDKRNDSGDIYAQLIDENGNAQWTDNGIVVSDAANTQDGSRIAESCSSSVIISWWDSRSGGYDIYAQRIDSLGNQLWTTVVNNYNNYQYLPDITADGAGGAFIVWWDSRFDYYDLYSQHIDKNGQLLWNNDGISIVTVSGYQAHQIVVSDKSGGFITLWRDQRDGQNDIYAQLTNDNIAVTSPFSGDIWNGTVDHTISWSMNTDDVIFDHLSIKASAGGMDYTINNNIPPTQLTQTWSSPNINSTDVILYIQAMNKNNSVLCTYQSDPFTMDSEPPLEFSLISPAHNDTVEKIITFEWQSTTDNLTGLSHYELWIDGSLFLNDLQNTTYTLSQVEALSVGPHTWTVRAVDSAGVYYEPAEYSIEVVYDNTPPEDFHLTEPENDTWTTANNPLFRWESSSDPGRKLKNYKFYLDGSFIDDISPDFTSFSEPILTPGVHTWYVTAVDSANNTTQSLETWTIKMDDQPPFSFSLLLPESGTWTNDTIPQFTWEQTSDTSTGIGLAEYELWIDDVLQIDEIPGDTTVQLPSVKSLSEGTHTWYIKAKDSLANSRNSETDFSLKVDVTKPSSFDLISPENETFINTLNPDFFWDESNDALSGLQKYQLYIDGSLNKDNISTLQTKPANLLSEGHHEWSVTAADSAGNIRNTTTFRFTADTT
ncbi:MAG: Ig-like domain-containing protein, partial [bacterium]